jgi:hypothetical protein
MKGDWKKTVSEYRASGMSQAEFSRLRGISKSSLAYQVRRSERDSSFIRIDPEERIELELPSGVILRVSEQNLGSVLRALQG